MRSERGIAVIHTIHQPGYFPWQGLLNKIDRSDVLIVLDEVQLSDSAYQNRNTFLTADGKAKFLTIPIEKKDYLLKPFRDLRIADPGWGEKHRNFLVNNYRKHPHFSEVFAAVEEVLATPGPFLFDVVMASMRTSLRLFGIDTELVFQSEIDYDRSARKGDLVIELLKASGATTYLSGRGATAYQDDSAFAPHAIALVYTDFAPPPYPQKGSAAFVPGLSCIDLLCNVGTERARTFIT